MTTLLTKNFLSVLVPEQVGQPFIGPHESCVPISPPPPPGGGTDPPGGGGSSGGGSGPPGGDGSYPPCTWVWVVATNPDGTPTNPPFGTWVPTNAPCSGNP